MKSPEAMTLLSLAPPPWILLHHFAAQIDSGCNRAAFKHPCQSQYTLPARGKTQHWPHAALCTALSHPRNRHHGRTPAPAPTSAQLTPMPSKPAWLQTHWSRIKKHCHRLLYLQQLVTDENGWGKGSLWLLFSPGILFMSKSLPIPWAFLSLLFKHCYQPTQLLFAHSHAK